MPKIQFGKNISKPSNFPSFLIQFLASGVLFFALGFAVGQKKIEVERGNFIPNISVVNQAPPQNVTVDFSLFWDVWEQLPKEYIDKSAIDGNKLLYGAISGMVRSLGDPYTAFLDPKQNEAIKDEIAGSYEGVGIQIGFNKEKRLAVIAPLMGTPAEKAGVRAKDLVLKIDQRDSIDLTLPEAVELIRGKAGTKVKLTLQHDGENEPYEVEVERAQITVKSVEIKFVDFDFGKVAVLKVNRFGDTTDSEWDNAVNQVQFERAVGVVVDMRNNPGGLLSSSVHLASEFVQGTIVKQEFSGGSVRALPDDHKGKLLALPMVVIINGGSASAAEIFAGAIADYNRGKVIGELSFGKGTVQDVLDLAGGSGLHVTVARWLTPDGHSIHEVGIKPDIEVKESPEDLDAQKDMQMDRAIEELKKEI